jgi:hypothetical protein
MATSIPRVDSDSVGTRILWYTEAESTTGSPDASYFVSEPAKRFVDDARAAGLALPESTLSLAPKVTITLGGTAVDLTFRPEELLQDLVGLYAIDGWKGVADARAAFEQEFQRRFPGNAASLSPESGTELDPYGTTARLSELDPRNQSSDRSGFPSAYDVSGRPGALQSSEQLFPSIVSELAAWNDARGAFDRARERLAQGIVAALIRIERLIIDEAIAGLNRGRDLAAEEVRRYSVNFESRKLEDTVQRGALKTLMAALLAQLREIEDLDKRYRAAGEREGQLRQGRPAPTAAGNAETTGELSQLLASARAKFEAALLEGRKSHPLCSTLAFTLDIKLQDTEQVIDGAVCDFLSTVIHLAETFEVPPTTMSSLTAERANWLDLLGEGPEQWLLTKLLLPQEGKAVQSTPLHDEILVAAVQDEPRLNDFEFIVLSNYQDTLWKTNLETERDAQAWADLRERGNSLAFGLSIGGIFVAPAAGLAAILDVALSLTAVFECMYRLVTLQSQFSASAQTALERLGSTATSRDWDVLGAVVRAKPTLATYADVLAKAGMSAASVAASVRALPAESLFLLMALYGALGEES